MEVAARASLPHDPVFIFEDGLGRRFRQETAGGDALDVLTLRSSFSTVPSFEFTLREQARRLSGFRHPNFAQVRSIERTAGGEPLLHVISDAVPGLRLSDLLAGTHARRVPVDIYAALCVIRQLVPAVAMLHERDSQTAHGALAAERLVVASRSRLVIVEHVLGPALEQLRYARERYWTELRIPLPPAPLSPRFDQRADILQIGIVALSLILGRPLRQDEYPDRLAEIVASTWAVSPTGRSEPLPPGLRGWLARALQLDPHRSFASAVDARAALDKVLGNGELMAAPARLESFLARYHASEGPLPSAISTATPKIAAAGAETLPAADRAAAVRPREAPAVQAGEAPAACEGGSTVDGTPGCSPERRQSAGRWKQWGRGGAALALLAALAAMSIAARRPPADGAPPARSTVELSTIPAGVQALINGKLRGTTPLVLALEPGTYALELRGDGTRRTIPLTVKPGATVLHDIELAGRPRR